MSLARYPETLFAPFLNDPFFRSLSHNAREQWTTPFAIDVHENKDSFEVEAEVPGFEKSQIHIEVSDNNILTISGQKQAEEKTHKNKIVSERIEKQSFSRSIQLPGVINQEGVKATLNHGILTLHLPKDQPKRNAITIQ
ncbi:heat shock protein Hsp20 [Gorgonomyces haynaldii]|nr:heat shock protein Hsp20 [Gorgonomyces haynaldii]